MTEWWDMARGNSLGAIFGGGFGVLAGVYGTAMGLLAPRGIGKAVILGAHAALLALAVVSLIAGIVAVSVGQPRHVWYAPMLAGFIGCAVLGSLWPVVRTRYRDAERRRLNAEEFRRG